MSFQSSEIFRSHLEHDHDYVGIKGRIGEVMKTCERSPPMHAETECALCCAKLSSLIQLRHHLGKHQQELSLFAIPSYARGDSEDDDESVKDDDTLSRSSARSIGSSVLPEEDACPICNLAFKGEAAEKRAAIALHMTEQHQDYDQADVEPDPRFPMFRVLLDRKGRKINPDIVNLAALAVAHWRSFVRKKRNERLDSRQFLSEDMLWDEQSHHLESSIGEADAMVMGDDEVEEKDIMEF